jgi:anti-sigma regulatory factor (Ser/Thr protein kinase)
MKDEARHFRLSLGANIKNLPVIVAFVENTSRICGLNKNGALSVSLATEEVFSYLCKLNNAVRQINIECTDNIFNFQMSFLFEAKNLDLSTFNITSKVQHHTDEGLESMGLIIASRSIDNFYLEEKNGNTLSLTLIKDKTYEKCEAAPVYKDAPSACVEIKTPGIEEIKVLSQMIAFHGKPASYPDDFLYPGKMIDMFEAGALDILIGLDSSSRVCGGIMWKNFGKKTAEFYGPYVFNKSEDELGHALLDECIGALARTDALSMVGLFHSGIAEDKYFESLGQASDLAEGEDHVTSRALFRQLKEDEGSSVWCHPDLEPFIEKEYQTHFFPREITKIKHFGESISENSVIATDFQHSGRKVVMRPILFGKDAESVIKEHVNLFKDEGIEDVCFEMDLGVASQCSFTEALKNNGFEPVLLFPYGGIKDIVIFRHRG